MWGRKGRHYSLSLLSFFRTSAINFCSRDSLVILHQFIVQVVKFKFIPFKDERCGLVSLLYTCFYLFSLNYPRASFFIYLLFSIRVLYIPGFYGTPPPSWCGCVWSYHPSLYYPHYFCIRPGFVHIYARLLRCGKTSMSRGKIHHSRKSGQMNQTWVYSKIYAACFHNGKWIGLVRSKRIRARVAWRKGSVWIFFDFFLLCCY